MTQTKIKITKAELDQAYEIIDNKEITGEASPKVTAKPTQEEDTTPFLTEEEETQDKQLQESLNWEEIE